MSTFSIPTFYRVFFTNIDPILSLSGVILNILSPTTILASYSPTYTDPPSIETILLLDNTAGFLAGFTLLQLYLLRNKRDMVVWKAVQGSMLVVDVFMLGGFTRALRKQGRLGFANWRLEEWGNIGITAFVRFLRSAFILGVGMGNDGRPKTY